MTALEESRRARVNGTKWMDEAEEGVQIGTSLLLVCVLLILTIWEP